MKTKIEAMTLAWIEEQKTQLQDAAIGESKFIGYREQSLHPAVEDVLPVYPPAYLVGAVSSSATPQVILTEENELVSVSLEEVSVDYMYSNPEGLYNLSVPHMMWRNPATYVQMSYQSWKIMQMRTAGTFSGPSSEAQELIKCRDWIKDAAPAPTILSIKLKNKAKRMTRVSIKLSVADNERKNVNFPITELKENIFTNEDKQAYVFLKIDPSKEGWGDIKIEVSAKPGKTTQIGTSSYGTGSSSYGTGTSSYYGTGSYDTSYYSGVGTGIHTGVGTSTSYRPVGYSNYDTKVVCVNCDAECFVGEDYCHKCGKCPNEFDTVA
mmetsp:Transcript_7041/g.9808  ORF Transcript_7041/g.9808 Transcript_7041/m.9808 type:complete len:323 (+) Transcript_7041:3325-4293(+)